MMTDGPAMLIVTVQLLVLLGAGLVGCHLARRFGTARIVGGVIAGLIIGPSLLGKLAPTLSHRIWDGGVAERAALLDAQHALQSALEAAAHAGPTDIYLPELRAEHGPRIEAAQKALDAAVDRHRSTTDAIALGAIVLLLLAAGRGGVLSGPGAGLTRAVPLALGAIAVPAALAFACSAIFGPLAHGPDESIADPLRWTIGLTIACAAMALPVSARIVASMRSLDPAADADRLVPLMRCTAAINALIVTVAAAALIDSASGDRPWFIALALCGTVAVVGGGAAAAIVLVGSQLIQADDGDADPAARLGIVALAAIVPLATCAAMGLPVVLGALTAGLVIASVSTPTGADRGEWPALADAIALPVVCAYIGTRIDVVPQFDWVWVLAAMILFGDAKSGGLLLAHRAAGGRWDEGLRLSAVLAAGGALPLVIALTLRGAGVIDQRLFVALVLANVVTAALAAPFVRMIAAAFSGRRADPPPAAP